MADLTGIGLADSTFRAIEDNVDTFVLGLAADIGARGRRHATAEVELWPRGGGRATPDEEDDVVVFFADDEVREEFEDEAEGRDGIKGWFELALRGALAGFAGVTAETPGFDDSATFSLKIATGTLDIVALVMDLTGFAGETDGAGFLNGDDEADGVCFDKLLSFRPSTAGFEGTGASTSEACRGVITASICATSSSCKSTTCSFVGGRGDRGGESSIIIRFFGLTAPFVEIDALLLVGLLRTLLSSDVSEDSEITRRRPAGSC